MFSTDFLVSVAQELWAIRIVFAGFVAEIWQLDGLRAKDLRGEVDHRQKKYSRYQQRSRLGRVVCGKFRGRHDR